MLRYLWKWRLIMENWFQLKRGWEEVRETCFSCPNGHRLGSKQPIHLKPGARSLFSAYIMSAECQHWTPSGRPSSFGEGLQACNHDRRAELPLLRDGKLFSHQGHSSNEPRRSGGSDVHFVEVVGVQDSANDGAMNIVKDEPASSKHFWIIQENVFSRLFSSL